ncbi:MAG TPA: TIGR03118 family protein [Casimicrobiaceae bacterium]|nr:TIGR03118 family protein [Casimicrobiaceae bacterium]
MNPIIPPPRAAAGDVRLSAIAAVCRSASIVGLACSLALPAAATPFSVVNLVTDDQLVNPAQISDPNLVNAWGISHSSGSPFWVSSNGKGLSVLYQVDPVTNATTKLGLEVTIPGAGNVTGQVFNVGGAGNFNGNTFLFVSEDGTVSGWRGALGTAAETLVTASPDNEYKGSAIALIGSDAYLYAADFAGGTVDVYKGNAAASDLTGSFTDPNLSDGYAPFNVQNLDGTLYVTYAVRGPTGDDVAGLGNGIVDAYDLQGNLLGRVGSNGTLNSPWGLAIAPTGFAEFAGDLLVGNFGDGHINIFDLASDSFVGQLSDRDGTPLVIDGLWGLIAGNDGKAGSTQKIYFSAGPGGEDHGLFGVLQVPEPASVALLGLGIVLLGTLRSRAIA